MKDSIIRKLTSRKLWAAIAGVIVGLSTIFGLDEGIISTFSGAAVTLASLVAYIVAEGRVDAAAVGTAVSAVQDAAEAMKEEY